MHVSARCVPTVYGGGNGNIMESALMLITLSVLTQHDSLVERIIVLRGYAKGGRMVQHCPTGREGIGHGESVMALFRETDQWDAGVV